MCEKNIGGNYYDKHNSKNLIVKILMKNFYNTILDFVKKEDISSMVDIGCGEGHLTNILRLFFENVKITALEYDKKTVLIANKLYPSLNVKQGNILNLKGKYDILISSEVLEHVKDFQRAIDNCRKVAPVCIFSVPNEPWFRIANIMRLKYLKHLGNTPGHINNWSKKEFEKLLKKNFKSVKIKTTSLWNVALCKN
jgi:2-polyprenyl-3-methyl-5-hydroxy-6-metoxy-1,4-benzoquinol methylase